MLFIGSDPGELLDARDRTLLLCNRTTRDVYPRRILRECQTSSGRPSELLHAHGGERDVLYDQPARLMVAAPVSGYHMVKRLSHGVIQTMSTNPRIGA
jgi:hypothetical protein